MLESSRFKLSEIMKKADFFGDRFQHRFLTGLSLTLGASALLIACNVANANLDPNDPFNYASALVLGGLAFISAIEAKPKVEMETMDVLHSPTVTFVESKRLQNHLHTAESDRYIPVHELSSAKWIPVPTRIEIPPSRFN